MNLSHQIPVNKCISYRVVENDKPLVGGILFIMPTGKYERKTSALCNKCGFNPKYPAQGLCRKCFFDKLHRKWVESRPIKKPIPNLPHEKWVDLKEASGYQISSMGRVKSLNYFDEPGRQHILKLRESRKGSYLKADIDKYNWRPSVHRVVALYFVPNPHNFPLVLHKDDNKQNNKASNLVWGTHSKNNKDYSKFREKNGIPKIKLTNVSALEIFNSKGKVQDLAVMYNVTCASIWSIKKGRTWSRVTGVPKMKNKQH